jgi:hypothetical protein
MRKKYLRAGVLSLAAGGLVLVSGCVVEPSGRLAFAPVIIAAPQPVYYAPPQPAYYPPPAVVVAPVMIPDSYVWDGYEYVGVVGDQYYYLGPDNFWLVCDPFRLGRFHGWEGGHADWRSHAVRNDRFRADRAGHVHPRHD